MNKKTIEKATHFLQEFFIDQGMVPEWAIFLNVVINLVIVMGILGLIDITFRRFIVGMFSAFSIKTRTTFDNYLVQTNFPKYIARLLPLSILFFLIPVIFSESIFVTELVKIIVKLYLIVLWVLIFRSVLRSLRSFLEEKDQFKDKPMESYVQVLMIFAWGIGIFLIIQLLTGYSIKSLATLGAASAVVLLIFKDTILGFVASIQISVNDIVRIGDWITFSKFGADGDVVEISLATVRVRNWDMTYTTIPTYSLISDSFQNWRGMSESGGRRIMRNIYIKQTSIKFLTPEDLERFKQIGLVKDYIEHRQRDIERYNERIGADKSLPINGRNQTNLGVFRYYIDSVLKNNSALNKDMHMMVRHQPPTEKGIPLQIYCFSKDKRWVNYEHIQADIFDHILAALPYFDLEVFELPSGKDVQSLKPLRVEEASEDTSMN